jgi:hypothetical protein
MPNRLLLDTQMINFGDIKPNSLRVQLSEFTFLEKFVIFQTYYLRRLFWHFFHWRVSFRRCKKMENGKQKRFVIFRVQKRSSHFFWSDSKIVHLCANMHELPSCSIESWRISSKNKNHEMEKMEIACIHEFQFKRRMFPNWCLI